MKEVIGIDEAAKILNVSRYHLRKSIANGDYPFAKAFKGKSGERNSFKIYTRQMYDWLDALKMKSEKGEKQ